MRSPSHCSADLYMVALLSLFAQLHSSAVELRDCPVQSSAGICPKKFEKVSMFRVSAKIQN